MVRNVKLPVPPAAGVSLPGLSGSVMLDTTTPPRVLRGYPTAPLPFVNRRREYRIQRYMAAHGLAAPPIALTPRGLEVEWLAGEPLPASEFHPHNPPLIALLHQLHRLAPSGNPITLSPLLQRYWQLSRCKQHFWLQSLRALLDRGEPKPLRRVPLHLDIHPGNIINTAQGLRLIDWEYAADGDIALDIAAICLQNPQHQASWITLFAEESHIEAKILARQVRAWQPWLKLLAASWYQLRSEQTDDQQISQLAKHSWQQLKEKS